MLRERVQTEALRTYLFAYGLHYASVSLDQVATSFQLHDKKVGAPKSRRSLVWNLACAAWCLPVGEGGLGL